MALLLWIKQLALFDSAVVMLSEIERGKFSPIRDIARLDDLHVTFPEVADDLGNAVLVLLAEVRRGAYFAAREAADWDDHFGRFSGEWSAL